MSGPVTVENGSRKRVTDWHAIEEAYRMGVRTVSEIAREHDISEGAIRKKAKTYEWTRDLGARVKAQADALVMEAEVRSDPAEVRNSYPTLRSESDLVRINAQKLAEVVLRQREVSMEAYAIAAQNISEIKKLKGVDLPVRVKLFSSAIFNLRTAQSLQREAYGITDDQPATVNVVQLNGGTLKDLLANVSMSKRLGKV